VSRVSARGLNSSKVLNAPNTGLFKELNEAIDADKVIGAVLITGSEKAFAGANASEYDCQPLQRR
jgi:enoyl-CoA hydratase/carnithine racemase